MICQQDDNYYYGIGQNSTGWKRLTRDIVVDLQKGIQASVTGDKKKKHRRTELKVHRSHVRIPPQSITRF